DEYCITAGGATGDDVLSPVPDDETPTKVDGEPVGRRYQESRLRFTAVATLVLAMRTHFDRVDLGQAAEGAVHGLHHVAIDEAVADIRLVRDDDHEETSIA